MKRKVSVAAVVMLSVAVWLGAAWPAGAGAVRISVSGVDHDCFTGLDQAWESGNLLHLRGVGHTNVTVSPNPEINGLNVTLADAEINLAKGVTAIRGTSIITPDGIAGTWEGSWVFIANRGVVKGQAVAQGTGALRGKILFLELSDLPPDPNGAAFCEGLGDYEGSVRMEGYILDTGAN